VLVGIDAVNVIAAYAAIILTASPSPRPPHQNTVQASPIRATCTASLILHDLITRTILGEEFKSLSFALCSFLYSSVNSSLLGPNILLNTLFSKTLSPRSSLSVSDQVSYPYKTTGKIIVLYILSFTSLNFWRAFYLALRFEIY